MRYKRIKYVDVLFSIEASNLTQYLIYTYPHKTYFVHTTYQSTHLKFSFYRNQSCKCYVIRRILRRNTIMKISRRATLKRKLSLARRKIEFFFFHFPLFVSFQRFIFDLTILPDKDKHLVRWSHVFLRGCIINKMGKCKQDIIIWIA